jgi:hypothetical protein
MSIEAHIDRVWSYFNSIDKNMYRLKYPSIPIVYFGDYISYKKSPIKIVTLGLNPSNKEFPGNNKFSRFYETADLYQKEKLSQEELLIYLRALNIYFGYNNYEWYDFFEPLLNAIDASFYSGYLNTVLHTNLFSPYATIVPWSKYEKITDPRITRDLTEEGIDFWHQIINLLEPNIIISSLGGKYRWRIFSEQYIKWPKFMVFDKTAKGYPRRKPYEIHWSIGSLDSGKKCLLICGENDMIPFMISKRQKRILGRKIYKLLTGKEVSILREILH